MGCVFRFCIEQSYLNMRTDLTFFMCLVRLGFGAQNIFSITFDPDLLARSTSRPIRAPNIFSIPFPSAAELLARPSGRPFTISIEGNIGAGKSTLMNYFMKYPDMATYKEPVDVWQNLNGTNFLDLAFKDQARWGMTFETLVILTLMEIHMADRQVEGVRFIPVKVMERSLHSARSCFIEMLKSVMTKGEMVLLDSWYDVLTSRPEFDTDVDLIVYLRTSPEVAMSRVKSRNRSEEQAIPLSYYQMMHKLHDDWLIHQNSSMSSKHSLPQVIVIDADQDISILSRTYRTLAKMVWKMIPKELRTVL